MEVWREMENAVRICDWDIVSKALLNSRKLLDDTIAMTAIDQIHQKNYPQKVADYTGEILLVGINYDKETKLHSCKIEKLEKYSDFRSKASDGYSKLSNLRSKLSDAHTKLCVDTMIAC